VARKAESIDLAYINEIEVNTHVMDVAKAALLNAI
jgi:hypothetical protein